jgi:hypothetical protein
MNTEALFLFLILLLGLVLCSFLGGNCGREGFSENNNRNDKINQYNGNKSNSSSGASTRSNTLYDNYNHFTGDSTKLSNGTTYYGPNGTTASVVTNSDGTQSLQIILPGSSNPVSFVKDKTSKEGYLNFNGLNGEVTKFYGPNNSTATIVTTNNGQQAIKVETSDGTYYYNMSGNNNTYTSTQYYGSTGTPIQQSGYSLAYDSNINQYYGPGGGSATSVSGPYGGSVGSVTGPAGNSSYYAQGPGGNIVTGSNQSNDYYDSLPPGIPRSQIPPGQEDLYILKSEVVPPVCPACPVSTAIVPRQESCPPCPACARCPEPSFECKKVPNYNAINNEYLPAPVLNDFSQFGM